MHAAGHVAKPARSERVWLHAPLPRGPPPTMAATGTKFSMTDWTGLNDWLSRAPHLIPAVLMRPYGCAGRELRHSPCELNPLYCPCMLAGPCSAGDLAH